MTGRADRPDAAADIVSRLQAAGIDVEPDIAAALARYLQLLAHWNRIHNLTSIREHAELIERHLVESLALAPYLSGSTACDIGSGAGLPGIPLAIRRPDIGFTLIESRRKRVSFLRQVAAELTLGNVQVAHGRAESLDVGPFANVLARAVAPPGELLALAEPLLERGGRVVLLTSHARADETVALATGFREIAPTVPGALKSRVVVLERLR